MKIKQLFIILAVITYMLPISAQVSKTINSATYSNASLIGPWVIALNGDPDIFIILDGNGIINEIGVYYDHKIKNIGTYAVTPSGAVILTFNPQSSEGDQKVSTANLQFITPDSLSFITMNSMPLDPLTNYMVIMPPTGELAGYMARIN